MRDLYRRLPGTGPKTTRARLAQVLDNHRIRLSAEDVEDIETVLLKEQIKPKYDRVHRTVTTIRDARKALPGVASANWTRDVAGEFFSLPPAQSSRPRGDGSDASPTFGRKFTFGFWIWGTIAVIGVLVSLSDGDRASRRQPSENTSANQIDDDISPEVPQKQYAEANDTQPLNQSQICELQERLATLGHYSGRIDGIAGPRTERALEAFVNESGTEASGLTRGMLSQLRRQVPEIDLQATGARRPDTGTILDNPESQRLAPLRIRVPASGRDYLIKLVNSSSGATVMSYVIRSGDQWETEVPLGTVEIRYASGEGWYGRECLFGHDTSYAAADETFRFYRNSYQVQGYDVELIEQPGGNLGYHNLSPSEF